MSPTSDDTSLLRAWQDHRDAESFRVLCERHAGLIEGICRRHGSPDSTEAVQAVFLVLARRAGTVTGATLGGWLTTTSQRVVKDQHRAAASRRRHEQEAAVELARQRASDGSEPTWADARQHLDAALASLSPARREAVLRFYLEGKPQAQVAAELGCSVDAVKTRVHESLESLRRFFTRRGVSMSAAVLATGLASEASASEPALVAACTHAVLTPAAAPGAAALAHGVITAMIIKTATLLAAGFLLVGSCLTAALLAGAEPATPAVATPAVPPAPSPPPAAVVKPAWAADMGEDRFGTWADLQVAGVTQRLRWIAPGTFTMGSSPAEQAAAAAAAPMPDAWISTEIQHPVTLTAGYWLADSACTQALWQAITGSNPASGTHAPQDPVDQVSWLDCQQFLSALNRKVRGGGFRLPSEAQWEFACRAGTTTAFSFGATITPEQVNYCGLFPFAGGAKGVFRQKSVPAKSLPPNPWGLYEMHGNTLQWCQDWDGVYARKAERDPVGPAKGSERVNRGGTWGSPAEACRSASRGKNAPDERIMGLGFRFAAPAKP